MKKKDNIEKILASLTKEELISLILKQAYKDEIFRMKIISSDINGTTPDKEVYRQRVAAYIDSAEDKDGDFGWYATDEIARGVWELLDEADEALVKGKYRKVILIAQSIIEEINKIIDCANNDEGELYGIFDDAFELLSKCSKLMPLGDERSSLFAYAVETATRRQKNEWFEISENSIEIAAGMACCDTEAAMVFSAIDKMLGSSGGKDDYRSDSLAEKLVELKYDLLVRLKRTKEAGDFLISMLHLDNLRVRAIEKAFRYKNFDRALELSIEGETISEQKDDRFQMLKWKEWQLKIHLKTNDTLNAQRIARELFIETGRIEFFEQFKKNTSKDIREEAVRVLIDELICDSGKHFNIMLADLYVYEKKLPELLAMVKNDSYYVDTYMKFLLKHYPKDVFTLVEKKIRNHVKTANKRNDYKRVCDDIRRLKKIGGEDNAGRLIADLLSEFGKRPAFVEELKKIKM